VASLPRPGLTLSDAGASLSVFALARASPERHLFIDDRRGLQRIALDMENTVLAEALPTRVFAGFQKWSFVLPVVHRYARLARIARGVWVFGLPDIAPPAIAGVTWVSLTERHPLAHEWFLVVDADGYFAALAAEELSDVAVANERRRFRAVWSFDDALVHELTERLGTAVGLPAEPAAASRRRDYRAQLTRVDATLSRLLARLQGHDEALIRAERLREDMTGLLMHDLRNPLSVILARTDLLTKLGTPSPEQLARSVVAIRAEARRLDEMLLSLVDVARIEAGRLQLTRTDLDVHGLVDGVAEAYRALAQAQEKAIAVGVEVPAGTVVSAERDKLVRVLSNLVGNALKYSERGGHVELRVRATAGGIEFAVSDDGPGVSPEAREWLFQRLGQAGRDPQRPGTHLGLYFCRLVVEAHGGTIGVDNRPARGVTFRFNLPTAAT
jgi:signal transduction histidine kinase